MIRVAAFYSLRVTITVRRDCGQRLREKLSVRAASLIVLRLRCM